MKMLAKRSKSPIITSQLVICHKELEDEDLEFKLSNTANLYKIDAS